MAGDWIKMRTDLHDDPAVVMMASAMKISEDEVVGKLHRLWSWADRHTTDGTAPAITIAWIDRYVGRRGFADAMILARWLDVNSGGIRIPKFERHNGDSAKSRAEATERKRASRKCHTESVTEVTERVIQSEDKNETREEKRREEQKQGPPDGGPIWSESLTILTEQGLGERTARSFLGLLCRDYDDREIVEAVKSAVGKADAKSYIAAILKTRPKKGEPERPRLAI